jgi:acetolactate synthase-1/2/3 large subunit
MTGAEVVADFIARKLFPRVFLVTGGACAFMVDAIGEHPELDYICFQHEQGAAMAADAVWRTTGQVGLTMATSGPGATNLITGIACSWFDSIPSFHITGQVNDNESAAFLGARVRQGGFQETDIVSMVQPITKFAKRVGSIQDLCSTLIQGLSIATDGRMGPVLVDVPMNVQKEEISREEWLAYLGKPLMSPTTDLSRSHLNLTEFLENAERPLILMGGGLTAANKIELVQNWCLENGVPYVSSWTAMPYIDRSHELYLGSIGVYGSRIANWAVQACDVLISLGSRLDNRQRTANPRSFAPFARKIVYDIDGEELKKLDSTYECHQLDLSQIEKVLPVAFSSTDSSAWVDSVQEIRAITSEGTEVASHGSGLNPYEAVRLIQGKLDDEAVIVSDCGANLCWVYQSLLPSHQTIFTAYGNSPMGYSLPAAIGAYLANPGRQTVCFIGDGGLQMNLQELQTIVNYSLPIKIIIQNNFGYGIIKQFQDTYFQSRHHASGRGYSLPSFSAIAAAYGIPYQSASSLEEISKITVTSSGPQLIDLILPEDALITPKVEMNRFLHDQFPYSGNPGVSRLPYRYPKQPSDL